MSRPLAAQRFLTGNAELGIRKEQGYCRDNNVFGGYCYKNTESPAECYAFLEDSWPSSLVAAEWRSRPEWSTDKQCALLQLAPEQPNNCPSGFSGGGSAIAGGSAPIPGQSVAGSGSGEVSVYVGDGDAHNVCWQLETAA